jgi:hypothetical protein
MAIRTAFPPDFHTRVRRYSPLGQYARPLGGGGPGSLSSAQNCEHANRIARHGPFHSILFAFSRGTKS